MSMNLVILLVIYLVLGICYVEAYLKDGTQNIPWRQYIPIVIFWPLSLWIGFLSDVYYYWKDHKKK